MLSKLAARETGRPAYVGKRDFCAIFEHEMNTLYSLALLLTADHNIAEQSFLAAFHDCLHGADVYPGWERSWSRRAIIKQAIRAVKPRPDDSDNALSAVDAARDVPGRLLQLRPFDRFVFAMTVLERFTTREAAAFLNCVPSDVEKSRVRVLQFIASEANTPAAFMSQSAERADLRAAN